jgi:hypothetical protein
VPSGFTVSYLRTVAVLFAICFDVVQPLFHEPPILPSLSSMLTGTKILETSQTGGANQQSKPAFPGDIEPLI